MALNEKPGVVKYGGKCGNALLYTIVAFATIGFSLFGYDQGLMSGIIASPQFNGEFPAVSHILRHPLVADHHVDRANPADFTRISE